MDTFRYPPACAVEPAVSSFRQVQQRLFLRALQVGVVQRIGGKQVDPMGVDPRPAEHFALAVLEKEHVHRRLRRQRVALGVEIGHRVLEADPVLAPGGFVRRVVQDLGGEGLFPNGGKQRLQLRGGHGFRSALCGRGAAKQQTDCRHQPQYLPDHIAVLLDPTPGFCFLQMGIFMTLYHNPHHHDKATPCSTTSGGFPRPHSLLQYSHR